MTHFPRYVSHESATCWKCRSCSSDLDGKPVESGYPLGRGAWRQQCLACDAVLFYDLGFIEDAHL